MLNEELKLQPDLFDEDKILQKPTRDGYGRGLVEAGEKDERVVVLCADLTESTRSHWFKEKFPQRFIEVGVAEQNLATVAAGLANYGKIPFISSYATFSPGRNNEQIRTTISLNNLPVKIAGAHAGISVGPDGATHQALEDIALMRVQPNMTVIAPCDETEARKATVASLDIDGPVYIRLAREATPVITSGSTPFTIGKALNIFHSKNKSGNTDVAILSTGSLLYEALSAGKKLSDDGVGVLIQHHATIKPLDTSAVLLASKTAKKIITVEEHQIACGFGSAISEFLSQTNPTPIYFIGIKDRFGESGESRELMRHFEIDREAIYKIAKDSIISLD